MPIVSYALDRQQLIGLVLRSKRPESGQTDELNRGQLERVGLLDCPIPSIDQLLSYGRDINRLPANLYGDFDPKYGFEIELV